MHRFGLDQLESAVGKGDAAAPEIRLCGLPDAWYPAFGR
ncbi:predicted protein [Streptomyces viridosporus ATCC 14672]|uniref:Predicted protein n=1 Tax=Streptomyces viridosporus (strain ATCC 14672 / DSM 40746 / JCM 4963 / KCTC 9882 / NRRL B-12104 / FH 1290) TaxID=566461 RepID=D6A1N6_STRV1|nr:predicted protein [Streptomyces viridosporus ATCC 14672]